MGDHTLGGMVRAYIAKKRPRAREELEIFRKLPLPEAIRRAALATDEKGKRFAHQRRLTRRSLRKAEEILSDSIREIRTCTPFDELHEQVKSKLEEIDGLGELYYYDTSLRIGANVGLRPKRVYLHRGTRDGARALGLEWQAETLSPRDLPEVTWVLEPSEMEDFLCIFKSRLRKVRGRAA